MERTHMETALSTDVVMDIVLSHLKVRDLLNCRKVSKFWNKSASSVLRRRSTMVKNILEETDLGELEECMTKSWDFPFAGLIFNQPWTLSSASAMQFFKNYGPRFTRLRLDVCWRNRLQDLAPFINHLSRLSILEVGWPSRRRPRVELLDRAAGQEDGKILKLSSVRTIRIVPYNPEANEDVLCEVFKATSPSVRIECTGAMTYEIFRALKSSGKLQAVSALRVGHDEDGKDDALRVSELLSTESPTLTGLETWAGGCLEGLNKILFSSQHTLKNLRLNGICPSEFSSECPVLAKLTTLSLQLHILGEFDEYVFQGTHGHKFPALKELNLEVSYEQRNHLLGDLSDGLFIVPSLTKIHLGGHVDKAGIEDLARCFPNVTEIRLKQCFYDFEWSRHSDPTEIWSVGAFKLLEKLRIWDYAVQPPTNIFDNFCHFSQSINFKKFKVMNMDSFLTGIPFAICENLRIHNQQNLMDSPFNEILRDSPSLLKLKNLKELIVCVKFKEGQEEVPEDPPFISMVSVWYALQMMPNLEAKFVYERPSPVWRYTRNDEERHKAVTELKAAFKHVHPYIELEPFFY